MIYILHFDTTKFSFRREIEKIFETTNLEQLHTMFPVPADVVTIENDNTTAFHKMFYARMENSFLALYEMFITQMVRHLYDEPIVYQRIPTFRIQLPGNLSVARFHTDAMYNHHINELNYFLPVTRCFDTNTIWLEETVGQQDIKPVELAYGEILTFEGARQLHGNKINETGVTRVSFDFRVIPQSRYEDSDLRSIRSNMKMSIGEYFALLV